MLTPVFENYFKKDIKRLQKRGKNMEKLKTVKLQKPNFF